ncbi:hypothetical protein OROHE_019378 [Orobanche hederae]
MSIVVQSSPPFLCSHPDPEFLNLLLEKIQMSRDQRFEGVSEDLVGSGSNRVDVVLAIRMANGGGRSAAFWSRGGSSFYFSLMYFVCCLFRLFVASPVVGVFFFLGGVLVLLLWEFSTLLVEFLPSFYGSFNGLL